MCLKRLQLSKITYFMKSKGKIAVLGADKNLLPFYKQAKALGYSLIGIATPEGAVCKRYCDKFYPISFADKEKVVEICKTENVGGITSFSLESAVPVIAYVADKLGFVSNSIESSLITSSKFNQREALKKAGVKVPQYYLIRGLSEISNINIKFPVIVKPSDSGGSQGISKIYSNGDLNNAYLYAVNFSKKKEVIIEEFIDGREFSVEFISNKGQHYFIQITDKVTTEEPRFVEIEHHQPANVSEELKERIILMVSEALTALKIENSASHTEIKLNSKNELYIIETGARMGGGNITSDLVKLSTGYDFVEGVIKLALSKFEKPIVKAVGFSGIYFYTSETPYVEDYIQNYKDYPEIVRLNYTGHQIQPLENNSVKTDFFIYFKKDTKMIIQKNS